MSWWLRQPKWWLFLLIPAVCFTVLGFECYGAAGAVVMPIGWLATGVAASYIIVNE